MPENRFRLRDLQVDAEYAYTAYPRYFRLGHEALRQVTVEEIGVSAPGCSTPSRVRVRNPNGSTVVVTPRHLVGTWEEHLEAMETLRRRDQEARQQREERQQRRQRREQGFREQLAAALDLEPEQTEQLTLHYRGSDSEQPHVLQVPTELMEQLMQRLGARWQDVTEVRDDALLGLLQDQ